MRVILTRLGIHQIHNNNNNNNRRELVVRLPRLDLHHLLPTRQLVIRLSRLPTRPADEQLPSRRDPIVQVPVQNLDRLRANLSGVVPATPAAAGDVDVAEGENDRDGVEAIPAAAIPAAAVVAPPVAIVAPPAAAPPPPRRRHAVIPLRRTFRWGVETGVAILEQLCLEPYSCGPFNQVCGRCGAKFFTEERANREGIRLKCCNDGRIELPPLQCPLFFRTLVTEGGAAGTSYMNNIRAANSLFAMASFKTSAPSRRVEGQGHWSFAVCGQIYHFTMGVPASQDLREPRLSHYYFLDVEEVMQRRCEILENRLPRDLLRSIENCLRESNRYIRAYRTMGEVLEEETRIRRQIPVRDVIIGFSRVGDMNVRRREFNLPESRSEIAAVFYGMDPPFSVDLALYPRFREGEGEDDRRVERRHELKNLHPMTDPMVYPLLFPYGEDGYHTGLRIGGHKITIREFYRYRLQSRDRFSLLHHGGKLFQQYVVDAWVRVEADQLWWFRQHQENFRFALEQAARRATRIDPANGIRRLGRAIVLPSSFQGGPKNMQRQYLDAMTVVARHGKPDLFVTFTCNPSWPEIRANLEAGQKPENRPDIVCRVFRLKLLEFVDDVVKKQIYGVIQNYHYVIEFQKRGLPHAHLVFTFIAEHAIRTAEQVDGIICATIPDVLTQPRLYAAVASFQIHRPLGRLDLNAPCMVDGRCKKFYPKAYREVTSLGEGDNQRPEYRRPHDHRTITLGRTVISNTRVVPYNPYALAKFQTHINFEVVGSVATMKYLYKYVTKGPDCATIVDNGDGQEPTYEVDEITNYLDCRYVSAMEAMWRLMEFKMHDRSHSVMVLPVHLPNDGGIVFDENDDAATIEERLNRCTKLVAWFNLNTTDPTARVFRYGEIPEHFTWETREGGVWRRRRQISRMIGCLADVSPRQANLELFYLRVLLRHVQGATSYEDLRTVNGVLCDTFLSACEERNLLEHGDEYDRCLREAVQIRFPGQLRRLFAMIISVLDRDRLAQVPLLWNTYKHYLIEDFTHRGMGRRAAILESIRLIDSILRRVLPETTCELLGVRLTDEDRDEDEDDAVAVVGDDAPRGAIVFDDDDGTARRRVFHDLASLNDEQKRVFTRVLLAVLRVSRRVLPIELYDVLGGDAIAEAQGRGGERVHDHLFYVDGPGGTGKTFLYNILLTTINSLLNLPVISVAWTGIAANLLVGGTTSHRCFKLPISLTQLSTAGFDLQSPETASIVRSALIVWDEAPMTHRYAVEAVDRYLREATEVRNTPMGGRCVIFGGDFRQVLPVIPRGHRARIIDASLKRSVLWGRFVKLRLSTNMRTAAAAVIDGHVNRPDDVHNNDDDDDDGDVGPRVATPPAPRRVVEEERFAELGDRSFGEWLLAMGEGRLPYVSFAAIRNSPNDLIEIPRMFHCPSMELLLDFVYGDDYLGGDIGDKAILCPTNAMVHTVNNFILNTKLGGEGKTYVSTDECKADANDQLRIPMDVLHSVNVAGLPPHELTLKVGATVMLLRNLDVDNGECNGTRMKVVGLREHLIECELITGERRGQVVWLPKIRMIARDSMIPQEVIRTQFPVRLAYAITINKAQGQTLNKVGIYLQRPCFGHGQLYVAFSRARRPENVRVYIENGTTQGTFHHRTGRKFTRNVVYHTLLTDMVADGDDVPPLRTLIPQEDVQDRDNPTMDDLLADDRNDHILEEINISQLMGQVNIIINGEDDFIDQEVRQVNDDERDDDNNDRDNNDHEDDIDDLFRDYLNDQLLLRIPHLPNLTDNQLINRVSDFDRPGTSGARIPPTTVPPPRRDDQHPRQRRVPSKLPPSSTSSSD